MGEVTEQIGSYRVVKDLASGGMARIVLAEQEDGGPAVVLKLMKESVRDKETLAALFRREARIGAQLSHPNIIRQESMFEHQGKPVIVLEYLEGLTVKQISRLAWTGGRALPLEAVAVAMRDCATALHAAHTFPFEGTDGGLVHRDVSAGNVVVTTAGVTKLIDFGVAKPDETSDLTGKGVIRGKPSYMSPEQIENRTLDGRADLWSLGVVFYFLLTGRHPFKRGDTFSTMQAVLQEEPEPVRALNPRVPEDVANVVAGLLKKNKMRRTSTGWEMAAQLHAALKDVPEQYLHPGRLLNTAEEAAASGRDIRPVAACLPSFDWDTGARAMDLDYEQTEAVTDASAGAGFGGERARTLIVSGVGRAEMEEAAKARDAKLARAPTRLAADIANDPSSGTTARWTEVPDDLKPPPDDGEVFTGAEVAWEGVTSPRSATADHDDDG